MYAEVLTLGMNLLTAQLGLGELVGLSWDSGAVTTGAVTVPLLLAIAHAVHKAVRPMLLNAGIPCVKDSVPSLKRLKCNGAFQCIA